LIEEVPHLLQEPPPPLLHNLYDFHCSLLQLFFEFNFLPLAIIFAAKIGRSAALAPRTTAPTPSRPQ
jgi:hypothetical protein